MLDVHPPHTPTHTWRDFLIHIATIVVGLLIAVGLEQTVEAIHHHHQRHELEEALQRDSIENGGYIRSDIDLMSKTISWALQDAATIEHADSDGPLTLHRQPDGDIITVNAGVWQAAKSNGVASLLPAGEQNWFEELAELHNELFFTNNCAVVELRAAYAALNQAIVGRAVDAGGALDLSGLTASQRMVVVENLRAVAERARNVLSDLLDYDIDNRFISTTPGDRLNDPEVLQRYFVQYAERRKAHPQMRYEFSPR
jgi:hypothetical protein